MGEGEIDRLDAVGVPLFVPRAVRAADRVRGLRPELRLERIQEALEEIQHEGVRLAYRFAYFGIDQRAEAAGPAVSCPPALVDPPHPDPSPPDRSPKVD